LFHKGPQVYYDPVPYEERRPLRVLSLFDGVSTAYHALHEMNLDVELYVASEIDGDALKVRINIAYYYLDDVRKRESECQIFFLRTLTSMNR